MNLTGQQIGEYIVGQLIGEGGMGQVYEAKPMHGSAPVALKILRSMYSQNSEFRQRFEREVLLMMRMQHEHIVPLLDSGMYEDLLYLTMKLISGPTLAKVMQKNRFSLHAVWYYFVPIAQALDYAHRQGVIHRDVKPSNVFLERESSSDNWSVYLGDFGLGKMPKVDSTLTQKGTSVGTIEYMSPQAVYGDALDHRTDVYSLAVMTYELMLNKLPIDPQTSTLVPMARAVQPAPHPRIFNPKFPTAVGDVLLRGLEVEVGLRYQSVKEFGSALYNAIQTLSPEQQKTVYQIEE